MAAPKSRKPLTPAEFKKVWASYLQTGSYSEAARLSGLAESTVRMAIKRRIADSATRRDLHAQALMEGEMDARELVALAREKLTSALKTTDKLEPRDLATLAGAAHDSARVATTLRINDAKLSGAFVERTQSQVTVTASPLTIIAPPEVEPE